MKKYFRLYDDMQESHPWFIEGPYNANNQLVDDNLFTGCQRYLDEIPQLHFKMVQYGKYENFTMAAFEIPVVSNAIGQLLNVHASQAVQLIPVTVQGRTDAHWIVNVIDKAFCLNEEDSTIMWWKAEDERPDKIGKYRMVTNLTLSKEKLTSSPIFRLGGWEAAIIIGEELKSLLEAASVTGVRFKEIEAK